MNKKLISLLMATLSCATLTGCVSNETSSSSYVAVSDIVFRGTGYDDGQTLYLERGDSVTLAGTIVPNSATERVITWSTDNYDIAIEDIGNNQCVITAYDLGDAKITASVGDYSEIIDVSCIESIPVSAIEVESNTLDVMVSQRSELKFDVLPDNATNKNVSFTVMPLGDADADNVKVINEAGKYYVSCDGGAEVGDQYEITIRASSNASISNKVTVNIIDYPVEAMEFKNQDITISLKDPLYKMLPVFTPEETTQYFVNFSSDNPDICDIDSQGRLIPKKEGQATIRAVNVANENVTCQTTVTVTNEETEYLFRGIKKQDVIDLEAKTYSLMDFEFDKVAFQDWTSNRWLSEDSTLSSHISDAGWAIWMVGFDIYDDDNYVNGAESNAVIYCKLNVPSDANNLQFVFRSHQTSNDYAKFRIRMIDKDLNVVEASNGWTSFHRADDMFYNVDVSNYKGQAVTFVLEQDMMGIKKELPTDKVGVSLMFRRCLFDTPENEEKLITSDEYSIVKQNEAEGVL